MQAQRQSEERARLAEIADIGESHDGDEALDVALTRHTVRMSRMEAAVGREEVEGEIDEELFEGSPAGGLAPGHGDGEIERFLGARSLSPGARAASAAGVRAEERAAAKAKLLASVAPLVKTICAAGTPTRAATSRRACSSSCRAARPWR